MVSICSTYYFNHLPSQNLQRVLYYLILLVQVFSQEMYVRCICCTYAGFMFSIKDFVGHVTAYFSNGLSLPHCYLPYAHKVALLKISPFFLTPLTGGAS